MKKIIRKNAGLIVSSFLIALLSTAAINAAEMDNEFQPMVAKQFLEGVKKNSNWKTAFATGQQEQIVFMNISPVTNPKNEIGIEVHPFDQAILIVEGKGEAVLNGKTTVVSSGDMIFIPKGTSHNVINLDPKKEMKLVSFYSQNDIPTGAAYKKKSDQPED